MNKLNFNRNYLDDEVTALNSAFSLTRFLDQNYTCKCPLCTPMEEEDRKGLSTNTLVAEFNKYCVQT